MLRTLKKLVSVLATFEPVTNSNEKIVRIFCIYYLVYFEKSQVKILFDSCNKINAISPDYVKKLGFTI